MAIQHANAKARARRLAILEYARDQILAKLERRIGVPRIIGEMA